MFITAVFRYRMTLKYEDKVTEYIVERRMRQAEQREFGLQDETIDDNYIYLPRFRTAGAIVLCISAFILSIEIVIMVLLSKL